MKTVYVEVSDKYARGNWAEILKVPDNELIEKINSLYRDGTLTFDNRSLYQKLILTHSHGVKLTVSKHRLYLSGAYFYCNSLSPLKPTDLFPEKSEKVKTAWFDEANKKYTPADYAYKRII